jgi:hypothetical protein
MSEHVRSRGLKVLKAIATRDEHSYFLKGFEPWTFQKKMKSFSRVMFGKIPRSNNRLSDLSGSRGIRYLAQKESMAQGLDLYSFSEFRLGLDLGLE